MKMPAYHPFRSAEAKERYLTYYDKKGKEWPVVSETKIVNTSYGQTFVRISGPSGALPLVLLAGSNGTSLMWSTNISTLSKCYKTYAVDNIYDFGRSVYSRTMKNSNDFVQWLDELFSGLGLEKNINLVGLSYGGWISSHYALHFPNRLAKLVLLSPAATMLPLQVSFIIRAFRYKKMMYWLLGDLIQKDEAGRLMAKEAVEEMVLGKRCFKPKGTVFPTVLKDQELQSIKVPTLYIVGENEPMYSSHKALERIHKLAPHIKTSLIPNTGHVITIAQPEIVNRQVLEFLKEP